MYEIEIQVTLKPVHEGKVKMLLMPFRPSLPRHPSSIPPYLIGLQMSFSRKQLKPLKYHIFDEVAHRYLFF
jgi:hypothetical protein